MYTHFRGNDLACDDHRCRDAINIYTDERGQSRSPAIGTNASRHALKVFPGHYGITVSCHCEFEGRRRKYFPKDVH